MTYSPALKWSIITLLPLTIGWKVVGKPENPAELQNAIVEFLTKEHFDVSVTDQGMEYMSMVYAKSRSCQLRVARVSPLGHEADVVRQASARSDRTFYVFRGTVYPEQPVRLTVCVNSAWYPAFPRCSPSSARVMWNGCLGAHWLRRSRCEADHQLDGPTCTNAHRFFSTFPWSAPRTRARAPGTGTRKTHPFII